MCGSREIVKAGVREVANAIAHLEVIDISHEAHSTGLKDWVRRKKVSLGV
jgi:hypothetical protein